uniref:Uncharacterized protein n=1 Tax=Arundo donax TaxID=35708 RepID=A0A0A9DD49_ARUDO
MGQSLVTVCSYMILWPTPCTPVGGSLYWLAGVVSMGILEFDLDKQRLTLIDVPFDMSAGIQQWPLLGYACGGWWPWPPLSVKIQPPIMEENCDDVAGWELGRTMELEKLLLLSSGEGLYPVMLGFAEDENALFLWTTVSVFMVLIESMQSKKVSRTSDVHMCHPFASVYTAGLGIVGGQDGPELLHNT